jgi:hypothetical protein
MSDRVKMLGTVLAVMMALLPASVALAAPGEARAAPAIRSAAGVPVVAAGAGGAEAREAADPELAPGCERARRRLFVEGEGWIIRRVTICR